MKEKVFVMIPYKEPFKTIYSEVLKPVIEKHDLESVIVRDEQFIGPIIEKIHKLISESDLCIADLTGNNPNVMYEVGIAITLKKPVIFITQGDLVNIPFDIRHHRIVQYRTGPEYQEKLSQELDATISDTFKYGETPTKLLRQMIVPSSLGNKDGLYVIAASPLSYREAFRSSGGWEKRPLGTYSDHMGIRGLMQAYGSIFGLHRLPELLNPGDFADKRFDDPCHIYSIGSPKVNWLTGYIMESFFKDKTPIWEFKPDTESKDIRNPKVILRKKGTPTPYEPVNKKSGGRLRWDFGLVIRGPHFKDPNYMFTIMAGRSARGTEACSLAVTDPDCIAKINTKLNNKNMDLDNHRHAFCAIVSVCGKDMEAHLDPDKSTFEIEDFIKYC